MFVFVFELVFVLLFVFVLVFMFAAGRDYCPYAGKVFLKLVEGSYRELKEEEGHKRLLGSFIRPFKA